MKKIIFLLALTAGLFIALPGKSQQTQDAPPLPYLSDKTMPSFDIMEVDSTTIFNTKDIPGGKPVVLMYFSPDCEHCQHLTEELLKNIDSLKQMQLVMFTSLPFDKLKNFYTYYKLSEYKNITVGRDYEFFFSRHFGSQYVPYLAIYDRRKKLVKVFDGGTKVSTLIQLINSQNE
jgi:thiol-disulfide isomerase/thioredoxin